MKSKKIRFQLDNPSFYISRNMIKNKKELKKAKVAYQKKFGLMIFSGKLLNISQAMTIELEHFCGIVYEICIVFAWMNENGKYDPDLSFQKAQEALEKQYGKPTSFEYTSYYSNDGRGGGFFSWKIQNLRITHSLMERFGPQQIIRIRF